MKSLDRSKLHLEETQREIDALKKEIKKKYSDPEISRLIRLYERREELRKQVGGERTRRFRKNNPKKTKEQNKKDQATHRKKQKKTLQEILGHLNFTEKESERLFSKSFIKWFKRREQKKPKYKSFDDWLKGGEQKKKKK